MFTLNQVEWLLGELGHVDLQPIQRDQQWEWFVRVYHVNELPDGTSQIICKKSITMSGNSLFAKVREVEFELHTAGVQPEFHQPLDELDGYRVACGIYADYLEEQGEPGDAWRTLAECPLRLRRIDETLGRQFSNLKDIGARYAWWSPERDSEVLDFSTRRPKFGFGSCLEAVCWQAHRLSRVVPHHLEDASPSGKYWYWKVFYEWSGYRDPNREICDRHPEVYYSAAKEFGIEHAPTPKLRSEALARNQDPNQNPSDPA